MISKFEKPILVTKSTLPDFEEYSKTIKEIWNSHWLTNNGPFHNELEEQLEEYLKTPNVTLFTNGHLALDSAIKALGLKGEVITTPFTFVSTTHAIKMNNIKPVFCDIKSSDYTIDEDKIEELITENTSAIIPVHVYGHPCNVKKIQEIAEKYNLAVIYDAAHAFGIEIDGEPISSFGDMSMFSFHATKVFNTIEGGALAYNNSEYTKNLNLIKNFGIESPESIPIVGFNAKMNEFQAAMGILNLKNIESNIATRKQADAIYKSKLGCINGLRFVTLSDNIKYNYAYMPMLIDENEFGMTRDKLYDMLCEYNVFARKYFFPLITKITPYCDEVADVKNAEYISDRIMCLPIYGDIEKKVVEKICDIIIHIHNRQAK